MTPTTAGCTSARSGAEGGDTTGAAVFKPLGQMRLPLPVRTLGLTAGMVPLVAFVLVPVWSRAVRGGCGDERSSGGLERNLLGAPGL